jgi:O-acetyl-ADP-ribose deacetylase (regulator of RNase III)
MTHLSVVKGDITKLKVDVIVNAAAPDLLGGGGVDGAIHRAAGPGLVAQCRTFGGCETGDAKITGGYRLPATAIIHTVGPIWHGGDQGEAELLASCYRKSLALAEHHDLKTIAFPAISCGVYGYPIGEAVGVAVSTIREHIEDSKLDEVILVAFNDEILAAYEQTLDG